MGPANTHSLATSLSLYICCNILLYCFSKIPQVQGSLQSSGAPKPFRLLSGEPQGGLVIPPAATVGAGVLLPRDPKARGPGPGAATASDRSRSCPGAAGRFPEPPRLPHHPLSVPVKHLAASPSELPLLARRRSCSKGRHHNPTKCQSSILQRDALQDSLAWLCTVVLSLCVCVCACVCFSLSHLCSAGVGFAV